MTDVAKMREEILKKLQDRNTTPQERNRLKIMLHASTYGAGSTAFSRAYPKHTRGDDNG